jgi:hypothetical protein
MSSTSNLDPVYQRIRYFYIDFNEQNPDPKGFDYIDLNKLKQFMGGDAINGRDLVNNYRL